MPTVSEKQVARWETKRSTDSKSVWVETMKQYTLIVGDKSYREVKAPSRLEGVKTSNEDVVDLHWS